MSMINADENFEKLGLTLPPAPAPAGVYKPCVIDGKYLYLSGHGPVRNDKSLIIGRIGKDLTMDEGKFAAQQVGLTMLATIQAKLQQDKESDQGIGYGKLYARFRKASLCDQWL